MWRFSVCCQKISFGKSGRGDTPDTFNNFNFNTCPSWHQTLSSECREVRKRKNEQYSYCPVLVHEGYIVNESSILTRARIEYDLTEDEKNQLAVFGKPKNGLIRLFTNRTYDSSLIYRVVKKNRILQFGDSSDCMIKLIEIGNIHKFKGGVFEMSSDNGGRLETLDWSSLFSKSFVPKYSDFVLIDDTHKINIHDLS